MNEISLGDTVKKIQKLYLLSKNIRIYHDCGGGIEKSDLRITVWHHKACGVITNSDFKGQIFFYPILTEIMDSIFCSPLNNAFSYLNKGSHKFLIH